MGPGGPQDGPKMTPRWPKMAPRWPQDGPKNPQDGHKMASSSPKMAQHGPKMAQHGPKMPQDGPRWPQDGPMARVRPRRNARSVNNSFGDVSMAWCMPGYIHDCSTVFIALRFCTSRPHRSQSEIKPSATMRFRFFERRTGRIAQGLCDSEILADCRRRRFGERCEKTKNIPCWF